MTPGALVVVSTAETSRYRYNSPVTSWWLFCDRIRVHHYLTIIIGRPKTPPLLTAFTANSKLEKQFRIMAVDPRYSSFRSSEGAEQSPVV